MHRAAVGNFEIRLIRESTYWWDGGAFFGVVPKTLWSRRVECDELNRIPAGLNSYLIQTGEHNILIETGAGDKMDARARERMKLPPGACALVEAIAREGVDPESIDVVVNSHLHWDHCGGNTILTEGAAKPAFPRARYFAPRGEWKHAHERHIRDAVSYIDSNYDPLVESRRMTLVDGDYEVAPGIWMRRAPGHNRDMTIVTAESGGRTFCFLSDMAAAGRAFAAFLGCGLRPVSAPGYRNQAALAIGRRGRRVDMWLCARCGTRLRADREAPEDGVRGGSRSVQRLKRPSEIFRFG